MAQQRQGSEEAGRVGIQALKARITDGHRVSSFSGPQQIISRGMPCGLCQHVCLSNTGVCQEQWLTTKGHGPASPPPPQSLGIARHARTGTIGTGWVLGGIKPTQGPPSRYLAKKFLLQHSVRPRSAGLKNCVANSFAKAPVHII